MGRTAEAWNANFGAGFSEFWKNAGWSSLHQVQVGMGGPTVLVNLVVVLAVVQVGSLFSADAWNNITYTAGEVKNPKRNLPLSLILGTGFVLTVYFLVSVGYLLVLPMHGDPHGATIAARGIQYASEDRVATAVLGQIFHSGGALLMAGAILISTFGCANGLTLAGARVYYAMGQDGLFFKSVGKLHPKYKTPVAGLMIQAVWTVFSVRVRLLRATAGLPDCGGVGVLHLDDCEPVCAASEAAECGTALQGVGISGAAGVVHRDGVVDLYRIIAIQAAVHVAGSGDCAAWYPCISFLVAPDGGISAC